MAQETAEAFSVAPQVGSTFGTEDRALLSSKEEARNKQLWRLHQRLTAIGYYRGDWDGQGATAPNNQILASAWALFVRTYEQPENTLPTAVVAGPSGTVLFEWRLSGQYMEAEITRPGHVEWMARRDAEPVIHWESVV